VPSGVGPRAWQSLWETTKRGVYGEAPTGVELAPV